jgi:HSP20 family protein
LKLNKLKGENMSEEKVYISPDVCMYPNDDHKIYKIEITLPGVEKDKIQLKMHEDSFFIKGESEDTVYIGSYAVCCPIDPTQVEAIYKEGLLKIEVPFKEPEFHSVDFTYF